MSMSEMEKIELELKIPEGKRTIGIRKKKDVIDRMWFVVKREERVPLEIEFECNEKFNTTVKWSWELCKEFVQELHNDKIHVLAVNGEENSVSIVGRFFIDGKQYAWRVPDKLKNEVKAGDWVDVPCINCADKVFVDRVVPTYKLSFFPEKEIKKIKRNKNYIFYTYREFWDWTNAKKKAKKKRAKEKEMRRKGKKITKAKKIEKKK